ncbi:MAG: hypothetical protein K2P85_01885 [Flavobacteriaceae bacterium]|nr:hypothetical protein [Flavobacteriaceae bacterium]
MGKPVLNSALKTAIVDFSDESKRRKNPVARQTKISDRTYFLNVDLGGVGGGIVNLIDNKMKKEIGITNFDGNMLSPGRAVTIRSVRALYTTKGRTLQEADWQNGDRLPAEIQASELYFIQGDNKIIDLPLTDVQGFKQADHRGLITNAMVRTQEEFFIQLEFPKTVSVKPNTDATKQFLRLEFRLAEAKK